MLTKYYPPILRRTHDMIEQHRNIVTFVYILAFCHSPPLPKKPERSKLRGIRPVASESPTNVRSKSPPFRDHKAQGRRERLSSPRRRLPCSVRNSGYRAARSCGED